MKCKLTKSQIDTISEVSDFLSSQDHDPEIRPLARKMDKIASKLEECE